MKHKILKKLLEFLDEDLPFDDITSKLIPEEKIQEARIEARENFKVFGLKYLEPLFEFYGIDYKFLKKDGEWTRKNEIIVSLRGKASLLLSLERTILNLLSHLSGITTLTHFYVMKAKAVNPEVRIACTRKTLPGLRAFEKEACIAGGADPHRFCLSDMILLKDNHLKLLGGIENALKRARELASFSKKIEIEVETIEDAITAARNGADIIMLDNMKPEEIEKVIKILKEENLRDKVILEASGGITLDTIEEYAKTGVDVISVGKLTHSAPSCDISMEMRE